MILLREQRNIRVIGVTYYYIYGKIYVMIYIYIHTHTHTHTHAHARTQTDRQTNTDTPIAVQLALAYYNLNNSTHSHPLPCSPHSNDIEEAARGTLALTVPEYMELGLFPDALYILASR